MFISFSKKIYKIKAIKSAALEFASLADFDFKQEKFYYKVYLSKIEPSVKDEIKHEFSNYVLSLTCNEK